MKSKSRCFKTWSFNLCNLLFKAKGEKVWQQQKKVFLFDWTAQWKQRKGGNLMITRRFLTEMRYKEMMRWLYKEKGASSRQVGSGVAIRYWYSCSPLFFKVICLCLVKHSKKITFLLSWTLWIFGYLTPQYTCYVCIWGLVLVFYVFTFGLLACSPKLHWISSVKLEIEWNFPQWEKEKQII